MTKFLAMAGVVGLLGAGTGWMAASEADTTRPDCPGTIVCPLIGDEVCADRCPADPTNVSAVSSKAADGLCGGTCPALAPAPKPDKPKGEGDERNAGVLRTDPTALNNGCCR